MENNQISLNFRHQEPLKLGNVLKNHFGKQKVAWSYKGVPVDSGSIFERDGWLPALMSVASRDVIFGDQDVEIFLEYKEPCLIQLRCGFFISGEPSVMRWSFAIINYINSAKDEFGRVELHEAFESWKKDLINGGWLATSTIELPELSSFSGK